MKSKESEEIAAFLARTVSAGADSGQVAETIVATCQGIDSALSPIIGHRGVSALYKRSLHLAAQTHSWLADAQDGVSVTMDLAALTPLLARQTSAEAAAAGTLLLQTFYELLNSLIGPSLTERLLRSVWAMFLSGPSAQGSNS